MLYYSACHTGLQLISVGQPFGQPAFRTANPDPLAIRKLPANHTSRPATRTGDRPDLLDLALLEKPQLSGCLRQDRSILFRAISSGHQAFPIGLIIPLKQVLNEAFQVPPVFVSEMMLTWQPWANGSMARDRE
jgi:hypothetical protein